MHFLVASWEEGPGQQCWEDHVLRELPLLP